MHLELHVGDVGIGASCLFRKKFLEQTCVKAGLPKSAWQDPQTIIHTFEAEVFSDTQDSL